MACEEPGARYAVLIADDDRGMRALLSATLSEFAVQEACDGTEALARLRASHPILAVLDVSMPGLTGIEVCRRVRADPALACMPIVLVSAACQPEDIDAGLAAGADRYVTKPFSPSALRSLVREMIGNSQAGQPLSTLLSA
jgi:CheY-like chemotaxis protein